MSKGGDASSEFTGFSKYFNATTKMGRANIAKATYACVGLLGAYFYLKPKAKAPEKSPNK